MNWDDKFEKKEFILRYSKFPGIEGKVIGFKIDAVGAAHDIADHQYTVVEIFQRMGASLVSVERIYPSNYEG
jgi:hypothetical protein